MECGNLDCRYELYEEEEEYYICPYCGDVITDNIPDDLKNNDMLIDLNMYSTNYKRYLLTMKKILFLLISSCFMANTIIFFVSRLLFKKFGMSFGFSSTRLVIIMCSIALLSNILPKMNFFRYRFCDIHKTMYFAISKWILYIILAILLFGFEKSFVSKELLNSASIFAGKLTQEAIQIRISNQIAQDLIYIFYVFFICVICDLINIRIYKQSSELNDELIYKYSIN